MGVSRSAKNNKKPVGEGARFCPVLQNAAVCVWVFARKRGRNGNDAGSIKFRPSGLVRSREEELHARSNSTREIGNRLLVCTQSGKKGVVAGASRGPNIPNLAHRF